MSQKDSNGRGRRPVHLATGARWRRGAQHGHRPRCHRRTSTRSPTAPASTAAGDTVTPNDAYDMLFGAAGTPRVENDALDVSDAHSNLNGYESFTTDVATFEETAGDHGLENLIYAMDPSAFYVQTTAGVAGTVAETSPALALTWFRTAPSATWPRAWTTVCSPRRDWTTS